MDTATSATGSRSQLIVPARMMPGARATMAASHGRLRCARAVAMTATSQQISSRITLTSKNQSVLPAGVNRAARYTNTPVSAGYSSTWSAGRSLM